MRNAALRAVLAIGIGLIAAPLVFSMFTRAPLGGQMIDEFRPFMSTGVLDGFEAHLTTIGAAVEATHLHVDDLAAHPFTAELAAQWPAIDADMSGILSTIRANLPNFAAVDALPPFALFPWFFVVPGLLAAALGVLALRRSDGGPVGWPRAALVALGLGLVAAPFIFGMFGRAPLGGEMIEDFAPLMTAERITTVQQSFLTIGAAEGELRREVLPQFAAAGAVPTELTAFVQRWPGMAAEMAPMIGAMSDNLDNFAAVDALPPFPLFPWFFLVPGLLLAGLALLATPATRTRPTVALSGAEA